LDPQKLSASPQKVVGGVYSRLLRYKVGADPNTVADHNTESDLALSLESPDAVTWTAKLRSDAFFHNIAPVNGRAVDSEDVKATYARALDPATGNPNRGVLDMIDPAKISTPDKQTAVFTLNYPYAPFPNIVGSPAYSLILSREVLTSLDPAKAVIGSGPFTLESADPQVAYTYKRNPIWFEKGLPYIDGFKIPVVPDASTQQAQFAAGNLDELILTDPYQVDSVRTQNPKATVLKADYSSANPLYFQMGDPASQFLDVRVRRAFSLAIDRDAISKSVYNGQTDLMVYIPGYMGKWAVSVSELPQATQQFYKYDPAQARKLLDAAGFSEAIIQLAYMTTSPSA
jgi:peptide/nickel transport system substrate-binding protein